MKKFQIIKIVVSVIIGLIALSSAIDHFDSVPYYQREYERAKSDSSLDLAEELEPAKQKIDNPFPFDSNCVKGKEYGQDKVVGGALELYNKTGIQLYYYYINYGKQKFASKEEAGDAALRKVKSLENSAYSIVIYQYETDYEYKEDGYLYSCDNFFYGDEVAKVLSANDLTVLRYLYQNAYNLFPDYSTREMNIWKTFAKYISEGYDYNKVVNEVSDTSYYSDSNADYYLNTKHEYIVIGVVSSIIALICLIVIIESIVRIIKLGKAEEEYIKAKADREILEADIAPMRSSVDDLIDKYAGDKEGK